MAERREDQQDGWRFTASTLETFHAGFLHGVGMELAESDDFTELWRSADGGTLRTAGSPDRVQCTLGSYTIPHDLEARCHGAFDYLHAGIIYQGAHCSETNGDAAAEHTPTPFVCLERGTEASVRWSRGERIRGVELAIDTGYLARELAPLLGLDPAVLDVLEPGVSYTQLPVPCISPLRELEHELGAGTLTRPLATALACWLVAQLARACEAKEVRVGDNPALARFIVGKREVVLTPDELARVERAHRIVLAEAAEFPTASALARRVSLGEQKLKAGFNLLYHQTIWDCGNEERMARAERLLRDGNMRVSDIAHALGYRSPSTFIEKFRAWAGTTPHQYRIRQRRREEQRDS